MRLLLGWSNTAAHQVWLLQNELRATGYVRPKGDHVRIDAFAGRRGDCVQRARAPRITLDRRQG